MSKKKPCPYSFNASYDSGREKFLRLRHSDSFRASLDLSPELNDRQLTFMGNLPEDKVEIHDQGTTYPSINMENLTPGHYHFKGCLKGDPDDMDPRGYTHLMVDPDAVQNLRLYTFIPNISGTIDDWIEELPRIAELGFNMVHLLPITPMDQSESPYSAEKFTGVDSRYLKAGGATLEDYLAKAKELGIGICFDLVLNHIGYTSEMARENPEWIQSDVDRPDGLKRAGCWAGDGWLTWEDLVLIDYDHPTPKTRQAIRDEMLSVLLHWGGLAASTGGMIRLDNLHSTNQAFLSWAMPKLHAEYPDLVVLAELFASPEDMHSMVLEQGLHLLLATPWDRHYVPDLRALVKNIHEVYPQQKFILPISSHDSGTPTQEFFDVRATLPRYAISALFNTGATGITQGVEYGAPKKIEFIGFKGKQVIDGPREFHQEIAELNALMDNYPTLHFGGNLDFIDGNHGAILGAYRHSHHPGSPHLVILSNLDLHHEQAIVLEADGVSLIEGDHLKNVYGSNRGSVHDLPSTIKLPPCGVKVLEVVRG